MTSPARCRILWSLCQDVIQRGIPGALVECGVFRGGSAAIMGLAATHAGDRRTMHLFDSYEGLPEPDERDGPEAIAYSGGKSTGALQSIKECVADLDSVRSFLIDQAGLSERSLVFHRGWFQDTVPAAASSLEPIALLRLDGDWYESTRVCLEHLYPLLSPGGYVLLDDYFTWAGCARATDEYRERHAISAPIQRIDIGAAYWQVPAEEGR